MGQTLEGEEWFFPTLSRTRAEDILKEEVCGIIHYNMIVLCSVSFGNIWREGGKSGTIQFKGGQRLVTITAFQRGEDIFRGPP